jgi:hypothetical protein
MSINALTRPNQPRGKRSINATSASSPPTAPPSTPSPVLNIDDSVHGVKEGSEGGGDAWDDDQVSRWIDMVEQGGLWEQFVRWYRRQVSESPLSTMQRSIESRVQTPSTLMPLTRAQCSISMSEPIMYNWFVAHTGKTDCEQFCILGDQDQLTRWVSPFATPDMLTWYSHCAAANALEDADTAQLGSNIEALNALALFASTRTTIFRDQTTHADYLGPFAPVSFTRRTHVTPIIYETYRIMHAHSTWRNLIIWLQRNGVIAQYMRDGSSDNDYWKRLVPRCLKAMHMSLNETLLRAKLFPERFPVIAIQNLTDQPRPAPPPIDLAEDVSPSALLDAIATLLEPSELDQTVHRVLKGGFSMASMDAVERMIWNAFSSVLPATMIQGTVDSVLAETQITVDRMVELRPDQPIDAYRLNELLVAGGLADVQSRVWPLNVSSLTYVSGDDPHLMILCERAYHRQINSDGSWRNFSYNLLPKLLDQTSPPFALAEVIEPADIVTEMQNKDKDHQLATQLWESVAETYYFGTLEFIEDLARVYVLEPSDLSSVAWGDGAPSNLNSAVVFVLDSLREFLLQRIVTGAPIPEYDFFETLVDNSMVQLTRELLRQLPETGS